MYQVIVPIWQFETQHRLEFEIIYRGKFTKIIEINFVPSIGKRNWFEYEKIVIWFFVVGKVNASQINLLYVASLDSNTDLKYRSLLQRQGFIFLQLVNFFLICTINCIMRIQTWKKCSFIQKRAKLKKKNNTTPMFYLLRCLCMNFGHIWGFLEESYIYRVV